MSEETVTPEPEETSEKLALERLKERLSDNDVDTVDLEESYDAMLNECYSFKSVGGIFEHMQPSKVLFEMDSTAYRCGMNDYEDSLGLVEFGAEYFDGKQFSDCVSELIDELVDEMDEATEQLDTEEDGDEQETLREIIAERDLMITFLKKEF